MEFLRRIYNIFCFGMKKQKQATNIALFQLFIIVVAIMITFGLQL